MLIAESEKKLFEELSAGILECKKLLAKGDIENIDKKISELSCIQDCLTSRLSKNVFTSNVIRELIRANQVSLKKCDFLEDFVNQSCEKISFARQKREDLEEIQHDLFFFKGELNFRRGLIDDAINFWERVLINDPGNKYIDEKLNKIVIENDCNESIVEKIKEIIKFYSFKEVGTAEISHLKWASGLCVDKNGRFFAGCCLTNKIVSFDKDLTFNWEFECDVVPQHLAITDNYLICSNQRGELAIMNIKNGERHKMNWSEVENAGREMIVCQRGGKAPYVYDVENSQLKRLICYGKKITCETINTLKKNNCVDVVTNRMLLRGIFENKENCFYYNQMGHIYNLDNKCVFKPPFGMKNITSVHHNEDRLLMMDNKEKAIFCFSLCNDKFKKISWETGECVRMIYFEDFIYYIHNVDEKTMLNKIVF